MKINYTRAVTTRLYCPDCGAVYDPVITTTRDADGNLRVTRTCSKCLRERVTVIRRNGWSNPERG